jgi:hypothetical protein
MGNIGRKPRNIDVEEEYRDAPYTAEEERQEIPDDALFIQPLSATLTPTHSLRGLEQLPEPVLHEIFSQLYRIEYDSINPLLN